jgi:hypothetical protein
MSWDSLFVYKTILFIILAVFEWALFGSIDFITVSNIVYDLSSITNFLFSLAIIYFFDYLMIQAGSALINSTVGLEAVRIIAAWWPLTA